MSNNKDEEKRPIIIKKVKKGGGHHGGAWKVAYADFVTAMMALFLVLWLVSQADMKLKAAIANYFRSPGVFDRMKGGIITGPTKISKEPSEMTSKDEEQALISVSQTLQKIFRSKPQFSKYKDQIKVEVTEEGLKIQLIDKAELVSFPSGSAEMSAEAKEIFTEIGKGICELPNPILIGGHTDKVLFPEGSTYTNWELSADRANAARRTLETACVKPEQIRKIVGYADTEPLIPEDPSAAANRRISITVLRIVASGKEGKGNSGSLNDVKKKLKELESKNSNEEEEGVKDSKGVEPQNTKNSQQGTNEFRQQKQKLTTEGSTTVGESDRIPDNVKKTREPKKVSDENR